MALLDAGYSEYSVEVALARRWLLENAENPSSVQESNYEVFRTNRATQAREFHSRISHTTFPEGFILQGLAAAGSSLLDERLLGQVQRLVDSQRKNGTWCCAGRPPDSEPIYAAMDACLGLRLFVDRVAKQSALLEIAEPLRELASLTSGLEGRVQAIEDRLAENEKRSRADIARFQETLFWTRPVIMLLRPFRLYPWLLLLLGLLAAYIAVIFLVDVPTLVNVFGAIFAVTVAALQITLAVRSERRIEKGSP